MIPRSPDTPHANLSSVPSNSLPVVFYLTEPLLGQGDISHRIQESLWTLGYPLVAIQPSHYEFSSEHDLFYKTNFLRILNRYETQIILISARFTTSAQGGDALIDALSHCNDTRKAYSPRILIIEDGFLCSEDFLNSGIYHEIVCLSQTRQESLAARKIPCCFLAYAPSKQYASMTVAEEDHSRNVILCVQDYTPERFDYLDQLLQQYSQEQYEARIPSNGLHVECYGSGWEGPFGREGCDNEFVFASHNCRELIVFDASDEEDTACVCRITLPIFNGASIRYAPDCAPYLQEHIEHDLVSPLCNLGKPEANVLWLEDSIQRIIERIVGATPAMTAICEPRYVLILGYFGWGNFGDEFILDTLIDRICSKYPHCIPVAVSEKPLEIFSRHSIISVALSDRRSLSFYMEHAACMLICAGLLFDIGIYYTTGRRSLLENPDYTDLPGLTAACTLAHLYSLPVLFYGAGAGPLVNTESRALVHFMGELGVRFLMRDEISARYIHDAGIRSQQIAVVSDIAFSTQMPDPKLARQWGKLHDISFTSQRVVVVSLRRWTGLPHDFEHRMAEFFDELLSRHTDFRMLFISFDPSDIELHEKIYQEMIRKDRAIQYGLAEHAPEVLSLLASSYTGIAMRLHCSILMNVLGRPTIGLNYLEKVEAQYQSMGQEDLLLPLDASLEQLREALRLLLSTYGKRAAQIIQAVESLRTRLERADLALEECIVADHTSSVAPSYSTDCYFRKSL